MRLNSWIVKGLLVVVLCPLLLFLAWPLLPTGSGEIPGEVQVANADTWEVQGELRGLWVSSVINLDYPTAPTTSQAELKRQADAILDKAAALGFNAVYLQVRPCADALYDSALYPWSVYLTGKSGQAPEGGFDPLSYWVEGAHSRHMELHAWINPYRITKAAAEWDKLAADSPAKLHPEWVVSYKNNYYFDPALPEVRQLVIDGAVELVENYGVDGIHMDDYFYPGTDFDDASSYAAYGQGFASIEDWRRDNVNQLVQGLARAIHQTDGGCEFGISPAGIWASKTLNPLGSDTTSTYSSYYSMYADTRLWVKEGWLDYIAPQIYWEAGHKTADFTALLDWWAETAAGTGVKLYIGLADYKTLEAKASDSPWFDGAEIGRQILACGDKEEVAGTIHFRYGSINASPALQRILRQAYVEGSLTMAAVAGPKGVSVLVDGAELDFADQKPEIVGGRVMLPMRVIFEALGAEVNYKDGQITAVKQEGEEKLTIRLELGSDQMLVNDEARKLDVAAYSVGGRTMLPLRAVSEAMHCKVDWVGTEKQVVITTNVQSE